MVTRYTNIDHSTRGLDTTSEAASVYIGPLHNCEHQRERHAKIRIFRLNAQTYRPGFRKYRSAHQNRHHKCRIGELAISVSLPAVGPQLCRSLDKAYRRRRRARNTSNRVW